MKVQYNPPTTSGNIPKKWSILCTLGYAINFQFVLSEKGGAIFIKSKESTEKSLFSSIMDSLFRFACLICMVPLGSAKIQSLSLLVAIFLDGS